MHPSPRSGKALGAISVAFLALVVLAGCSLVQGTVETGQALSEAGFRAPSIRPEPGDRIRVRVRKDQDDLDACAKQAGGIVWARLPLPIQHLEVRCGNGFGGRGGYAAGRDQLVRDFGPRPAGLDDAGSRVELRRVGLVAVIGLAVGLAVLAGVGVVIALAVRQARRRRPPAPPPGTAWPPGPAQQQQPPPPPPPPPPPGSAP